MASSAEGRTAVGSHIEKTPKIQIQLCQRVSLQSPEKFAGKNEESRNLLFLKVRVLKLGVANLKTHGWVSSREDTQAPTTLFIFYHVVRSPFIVSYSPIILVSVHQIGHTPVLVVPRPTNQQNTTAPKIGLVKNRRCQFGTRPSPHSSVL